MFNLILMFFMLTVCTINCFTGKNMLAGTVAFFGFILACKYQIMLETLTGSQFEVIPTILASIVYLLVVMSEVKSSNEG